jgi:chromosome segregation ATPase
MENGEQPATRSDLLSVKQDIESVKQDIESVKQNIDMLRGDLKQDIDMLRGEVNHQYADLVERMSDGQTELLKAFYSYAQGNNKRMMETEGNLGAFRSRLATLEDRILEVEKRLNIPPAA